MNIFFLIKYQGNVFGVERGNQLRSFQLHFELSESQKKLTLLLSWCHCESLGNILEQFWRVHIGNRLASTRSCDLFIYTKSVGINDNNCSERFYVTKEQVIWLSTESSNLSS